VRSVIVFICVKSHYVRKKRKKNSHLQTPHICLRILNTPFSFKYFYPEYLAFFCILSCVLVQLTRVSPVGRSLSTGWLLVGCVTSRLTNRRLIVDIERVLCALLLLVGYTGNRSVHRAPVTGERTCNAVSVHKNFMYTDGVACPTIRRRLVNRDVTQPTSNQPVDKERPTGLTRVNHRVTTCHRS